MRYYGGISRNITQYSGYMLGYYWSEITIGIKIPSNDISKASSWLRGGFGA